MKKKAGVIILMIVLVLAGGFWGTKRYLQKKAADEIRIMVDNAGAVEDITYAGLTVNPLSMKADMEDVTVSLADGNGRIDIARIELNEWALEGDIPVRADIRMSGISAKTDRFENPYRRIANASIQLAYATDFDSKLLIIEKLMVHAPEIGKLDVRCRLANVDLEKMVSAADNPLFFVLVLPGISVSSVDIRYQDEKFVRRLIDEAAAQSGRSRDDYLSILKQKLMELKEDGTSTHLDNALAGLIQFLHNPRQIRIKAAPAKPVPLGQFMFSKDRGMLFEMLKIQVNADAEV